LRYPLHNEGDENCFVARGKFMIAAETEILDLPTLLERLVDVSDRGRDLLAANQVDEETSPLLRDLLGRIDATIDCLEDLLDVQESIDAAQTGTIPWAEGKRQLGI
jgi:hypothetical protein